jgi:predicted N-acetyltransferase YhbS
MAATNQAYVTMAADVSFSARRHDAETVVVVGESHYYQVFSMHLTPEAALELAAELTKAATANVSEVAS